MYIIVVVCKYVMKVFIVYVVVGKIFKCDGFEGGDFFLFEDLIEKLSKVGVKVCYYF